MHNPCWYVKIFTQMLNSYSKRLYRKFISCRPILWFWINTNRRGSVQWETCVQNNCKRGPLWSLSFIGSMLSYNKEKWNWWNIFNREKLVSINACATLNPSTKIHFIWRWLCTNCWHHNVVLISSNMIIYFQRVSRNKYHQTK